MSACFRNARFTVAPSRFTRSTRFARSSLLAPVCSLQNLHACILAATKLQASCCMVRICTLWCELGLQACKLHAGSEKSETLHAPERAHAPELAKMRARKLAKATWICEHVFSCMLSARFLLHAPRTLPASMQCSCMLGLQASNVSLYTQPARLQYLHASRNR